MSYELVNIIILTVLSTIDNALLAGIIYPHSDKANRREVMIFVGIVLMVIQSLFAMGIRWLLTVHAFRIMAIACLVWMSVLTIVQADQETRSDAQSPLKLSMRVLIYTVVGNLDNLLWLGAAVKHEQMLFVIISMLTIPLFVAVANFLAAQTEQYRWVIIIGSGMMAWAAASLLMDYETLKNISVVYPQLTKVGIAVLILGVGFLVRRLRWATRIRGHR